MGNSDNSMKLIGALLVGAAVGGALGILFAPDKGSATRKKIAGKTTDLTDSLQEKFQAFLEDAKQEFESVKEKATALAENTHSKK